MIKILVLIAAAYLILMNVLAFAAYGRDKRLAQNERWRTPERRLLLYAALGGAAGAWFGMRHFHHKTKKLAFRILVPLFLLLWLGLLAGAVYLYTKGIIG